MEKDYYDILGVNKDSSKDYIKRAYHLLANQYHPDKINGSEKRFKEINEAYLILSDDESRDRYDKKYSYTKEDPDNELLDEECTNIALKKIITWANTTEMRIDRREDIIQKIKNNNKLLSINEIKNLFEKMYKISIGLDLTFNEISKLIELNNKKNTAKKQMENNEGKEQYEIALKNLKSYVELLKKN